VHHFKALYEVPQWCCNFKLLRLLETKMYEVREASNDAPNVVKISQLVNMQGSRSHAHTAW